jgi:CRP/FNR family transcriptional regulator, cyclic AMP receptor protein
MRAIPYLHDFISELPPAIREAFQRNSSSRTLAKGEAAYRKGDPPQEVFRIEEGAIKLCNYSMEGVKLVTGELRPGDCFGEMGMLDGLPRVSHAIASKATRLSVINRAQFERLCDDHPEIYKQLNIMLCRRIRFLYALNEETVGLRLDARLGRALHRLAYSHGQRDDSGTTYVEISHEELSHMLGASRQSVSKTLKSLEREGDVDLRYGKIYFRDLRQLGEKFETSMGMEQLTPVYNDAQ